jgi:predicted DNA-binding transcriptional regulator YafY
MVVRQWALIEAVKAARRGLTVGQLRERVGASRATIYRDLEVLQAAGVPIAAERVNGEVRHRLLHHDPAAPLRPDELAALRLARRLLAPLEGTRLVESLDRLLGRLAGGGAPSPLAGVTVGTEPGARSPDAVRAVDLAIREGHRIAFAYRAAASGEPAGESASGDERAQPPSAAPPAGGPAEAPVASGTERRVVDPVALRLHRGHVYLVGFDLHRRDWRIFKVVRVEGEVERVGAADPHPDYDEDALFAHSVGIWTGAPVDVAVRLAPAVASRAAEWPLVVAQVVDPQDDGSVVIRARVAGVMEALRWTLSWGGEAEALEPADLRDAVRDELARAHAAYLPRGE